MGHSVTPASGLPALERMVVASVAVTARALADVAPELTFLQWRVLVVLESEDGEPVGRVATTLDAKIAAVSRLIGRLRRRGLVDAHRDLADARVVRVKLTPEGQLLRTLVVERRRTDLVKAIGPGLSIDAIETLDRMAGALAG